MPLLLFPLPPPPPPPPLPDSRLLYMSSLERGGRWRIGKEIVFAYGGMNYSSAADINSVYIYV